MRPKLDLSDQPFGRLIAQSPAGPKHWNCACKCGAKIVVRTCHLRSGHTTSCGCAQRDAVAARARHGDTRGGVRTPEHRAWQNMWTRVTGRGDEKNRELYVGRGITACDRWRVFENFLADMGRRPSPRHSLDRIDNNGNYEPGNCRWAIPVVQANNRRPRRSTAEVQSARAAFQEAS